MLCETFYLCDPPPPPSSAPLPCVSSRAGRPVRGGGEGVEGETHRLSAGPGQTGLKKSECPDCLCLPLSLSVKKKKKRIGRTTPLPPSTPSSSIQKPQKKIFCRVRRWRTAHLLFPSSALRLSSMSLIYLSCRATLSPRVIILVLVGISWWFRRWY